MPLVTLILLPFLGSVIAALMPANARNAESTLAGVIALACATQAALYFPDIAGGQVLRQEIAWLPSLGLNFTVRMDGFAWMFSMLVLGIGALVVLYARYYMSPQDPVPRFFAFFLAFMGAMAGVVLSGNTIQLVFFWELTSLFSFLLIGYWHHRKDARRGARMALTVTGAGGLALLGGVLLLGHIAGSYELDVVLASGDRIRAHPYYLPMLVLVLLGALTKSAQFPFHFWLPRAMAAPTPVSAYLHSATMVKAGVFLLARLWPALAGTEAWFWILGGAGAITLVIGSFKAIFQNDLKGLLAYSTVSQLGLIAVLLSLNSPMAAVAGVFHIINHATFKASLFMTAGIIDHETGTRDIRRLSGLIHVMPITGTLAIVASAAMAGVPLLNGFLSKEMFFAETVHLDATGWLEITLPLLALAASMFGMAYSLRFTASVFFGKLSKNLPREPHEPVRWMRIPIELLVLMCLLVGMLPGTVIGPVLDLAAGPVVGGQLPEYSLALWHGINAPLIMSLIAMAGGLTLYLLLRKPQEADRIRKVPFLGRLDGERMFNWTMALVQQSARRFQRVAYTRRLQAQMFMLILACIIVVTAALAVSGLSWGDRPGLPLTADFALLWLLGAACAIGAAAQAKFHRLAALILMGGAGLATCLTFVWFSAPDLALTQLSVEVVTTIVFLLALRWLPKREPRNDGLDLRARVRRLRDLILAIVVGSGMAVLSYALMTRQTPQSISPFFLERALPEGGGTNVVNVMLVDFRAFDTMGEIVVLAAVGLTVYALLRRFRPPLESIEMPRQQAATPADLLTDLVNPRNVSDTAVGYLMVPAVLTRVLLPITMLLAAHLFLRGHNAPGGGFVAGLVMSIGLLAQFMIAGTQWVEAHFNLDLRRWISYGLLIAGLTGLGSLALGYPFMTTHTAHLTLPLLGEVHLPTAALFDLGVFMVVVGSTLLMLTAIAHQSIRRQRKPVRDEGATSESVAPDREEYDKENT